MIWAELKASVGMNACRCICNMIRIIGVKIAIETEVTVSAPLDLKGSSDSLAAGGAPKTVDGGYFLGVLHWEMEAGAIEEACCNCSMTPMNCRLIVAVVSPEDSVVSARGGGMTGVESGFRMVDIMPSGCMLPRSTTITCGLQAGLLGVTVSQRGSSLKVNCEASIWLLSPSGPYTVAAYTHGGSGVDCECV